MVSHGLNAARSTSWSFAEIFLINQPLQFTDQLLRKVLDWVLAS